MTNSEQRGALIAMILIGAGMGAGGYGLGLHEGQASVSPATSQAVTSEAAPTPAPTPASTSTPALLDTDHQRPSIPVASKGRWRDIGAVQMNGVNIELALNVGLPPKVSTLPGGEVLRRVIIRANINGVATADDGQKYDLIVFNYAFDCDRFTMDLVQTAYGYQGQITKVLPGDDSSPQIIQADSPYAQAYQFACPRAARPRTQAAIMAWRRQQIARLEEDVREGRMSLEDELVQQNEIMVGLHDPPRP